MVCFLFFTLLANDGSPSWHMAINQDGFGCGGYDPVSYFQTTPQPGLAEFTATFQSVRYRFRNRTNQSLFEADPQRYVPAFGGWCAFGCAVDPVTYGFGPLRFQADPTHFRIIQGRLLLFAKLPTFDALHEWSKFDDETMLERADDYWQDRQRLARKLGSLPPGMNPNAPMELAQFGFLIGKWDSQGQIMVDQKSQKYQSFQGIWSARYDWDGYAVFDDWKPIGVPGASGPAVRTFNTQTKKWTMVYTPIGASPNAVWVMEGAFNGAGEMVATFSGKDRQQRAFTQRVRFFNIQPDQFSWEADRSYDGGKTWIPRFQFSEQTRLQ